MRDQTGNAGFSGHLRHVSLPRDAMEMADTTVSEQVGIIDVFSAIMNLFFQSDVANVMVTWLTFKTQSPEVQNTTS